MMNTVGERLRYARTQTGISQDDLAKSCGFKGGQKRVSNYEGDEREPSYADLTLMGKVLGVNAAWIAFGGSSDADDLQTFAIAKTEAGDSNTAELRILTEAQLIANKSQRKPNPDHIIRMDAKELERANVTATSVFCYRMTGNSMAPVITDNALVGINPIETQVRDGELYLIKQGDLVSVRRLYRLPNGYRLKSYNEAEWPVEIIESPTKAQFTVIGRVFWVSSIR